MFSRNRVGLKIKNDQKFSADGRKSNFTYLLLLLLFNTVYYVLCIIKFPVFSSDDFILISKLTAHEPVSLFREEIFFLNFRPVFYFYFGQAYSIAGGNPLIMKLLSLVLHLILVVVLYNLASQMLRLTGNAPRPLPVFISLLIFSVHPDVMLYILHLNNATELLMLLFYASALLVIVMYAGGRMPAAVFMPAVLILFLLSALSKQTGIHLPLLVLYWFFFLSLECRLLQTCKSNVPADGGAGHYKFWWEYRCKCFCPAGETARADLRRRGKMILAASIAMAVFTLGFTYGNIVIAGPASGETGTAPVKLFSAAGTLLFVTLPFIAEKTYAWFLFNKDAAYAAAFTAIPIIALFAVRKKIFLRILTGAVFTLFVFFPRIAAHGGGRVNSHLVMWFAILICFVLHKEKMYLYALSGVYFLGMLAWSVCVLNENVRVQKIREKQIYELEKISKQVHPKKVFVALCNTASFGYEYTYLTKGKFDEVQWQPLIYKSLFPDMEEERKIIEYTREGNAFKFKSIDNYIFLAGNPINRMKNTYKIQPFGELLREYKNYLLSLPDSIINNEVIVFHNGLNWEIVK